MLVMENLMDIPASSCGSNISENFKINLNICVVVS